MTDPTNAARASELAILSRVRERSERILGQNASNTAKALAKDALELVAIIEDFQAENRERAEPLPVKLNRKMRRALRHGDGLGSQLDHSVRQGG